MARKDSKRDPYAGVASEDEAPVEVIPCWLCGRPMGKTIVWHHPVPNFTNSEFQRYGMDVAGLLANPAVRKFVDWVANKDPDFTATIARKTRGG